MASKPPIYPNESRPRPGPSDLALRAAAEALKAGRPREAEYLAAEVLKANAGSLPALQLLGTALLTQGRGKDAIEPLERAARQSRDAETETRLAIALRQSGRAEEARERLERAVKRKPPFPPAFLELGSLLAALNRHDEAIDVPTEVWDRFPANSAPSSAAVPPHFSVRSAASSGTTLPGAC